MKKHFGLMVFALSVAFAALAAAQAPAPPASPVPVTAPELAPPAPPAPPAPAVTPAAAPKAPPAPAAAAAAPQTPQPPPPAAAPRPAKPAKTPEPPKPAEATSAPEPPQPPMAMMPGRERGEPDPVNVRFEVMVEMQSGTTAPIKRSALLTVSNNTGYGLDRGMLRSGNNVPVATTSLVTRTEDGKETPAAKPLTSYNYRSVGLNVDIVSAVVVAGNRVRAVLNIEFSGVDEKIGPGASGAPPSFPTFSQRVPLYLENGKPVIIAQSVDGATNLTQKVEVKATILR